MIGLQEIIFNKIMHTFLVLSLLINFLYFKYVTSLELYYQYLSSHHFIYNTRGSDKKFKWNYHIGPNFDFTPPQI